MTTGRRPLRALSSAASAFASAISASALEFEQPSLLGLYTPTSDVGNYARLDEHARHVEAALASSTDETGMAKALDAYENGIPGIIDLTVKLKGLAGWLAEEGYVSPTFGHYVDYYGEPEYVDQWLEAAFGGTDFKNMKAEDYPGKGSFLFSALGIEGRAAAIKRGMPLLLIWMGVVTYLEKAAQSCNPPGKLGGTVANADNIEEWDTAVALYVGSEAKLDDNDVGHFVFTLVQEECLRFGTCDGEGDLAPNNREVFARFEEGRRGLNDGDCPSVRQAAAGIKRLMTVVLAQGVLRTSYAIDVQDNTQQTTQGYGAAYAAALLPLISTCSVGNAFIVHDDLEPGAATRANYEVVRAALERSYDCLGIGCDDVGGLVDPSSATGGYLAGAGPCGNNAASVGASSGGGSATAKEESSAKEERESGGDEVDAAAPTEPKPYNLISIDDTALDVALACGILGGFVLGLAVACLYLNTGERKRKRDRERAFVGGNSPEPSKGTGGTWYGSQGSLA